MARKQSYISSTAKTLIPATYTPVCVFGTELMKTRDFFFLIKLFKYVIGKKESYIKRERETENGREVSRPYKLRWSNSIGIIRI